MLSKLLRPTYKSTADLLILRKVSPKIVLVRHSDLIPKSQYDIPIPKKLHLGYAMKVYWEIIPLIITTVFAVSLTCLYSLHSCMNKLEHVFSTHNRKSLCRTMDLRNPTVHKLIIINQRYEPWPEMQDVQDKMKQAEKRALVRLQTCSLA